MPYALPQIGDPAPWFVAPSSANPNFHFENVAGLYVVLAFFGSCANASSTAALKAVAESGALFDDRRVCMFGVTGDRADPSRVPQFAAGVRYIWDFDFAVGKMYGAVDQAAPPNADRTQYRQFFLVLDPMQRVLKRFSLEQTAEFLKYIAELPPIESAGGHDLPAPVLVAPRIFEPEFCQHLMSLYDKNGGHDSGFMRDVEGKTVGVIDYSFKRRSDYYINDERTLFMAKDRIERRLAPLIERAFRFKVTRMERYIVVCYDSNVGGYFLPHRDDTTKGTAHRRFAVTINLNAEDYEGGELRFPEFSRRTYRAPTGGAVVFSCSMLHEALPVKNGKRYAFLPFLYDEDGAKTRMENNKFLGDGVAQYQGEVA